MTPGWDLRCPLRIRYRDPDIEVGRGVAVTDNVHVTTPPPDDAMTG